jgi:6,7-dimethyl-8-ribityllumazine synthase
MAGHGSPTSALAVDGNGIRVVIVAGLWHEKISDGLIAGAQRALDAAGAQHTLVRVAGSFELPLACQVALENGADAAVALGVIIRGGTPHFEYVSDAATSGLLQVTLSTGKPVGFGVLTLDDEQQGLDRAGLPGSKEDKGEEAAVAALQSVHSLRALATK